MLDTAVDIAIVVTLWATGLELGLTLGVKGVVDPLRRVGLVARAVTLDVAVIPLVVWALVTILAIPTDYAVGLLLVGAASAGPLGIKMSQLAHGDVGYAVSLVVLLEVANAAAIPVWSALLMPAEVVIPYAQLILTLAAVLLLPLAVGAAVGNRKGIAVQRLARPLRSIGNLGLAAVILLIIGRDLEAVVDASTRGVAAVATITVGIALVAGWILGGPARPTRISTGLVTSVRANALALAVARSSFPNNSSTAVAVVAFGVISITVPTAVALWMGSRARVVPLG